MKKSVLITGASSGIGRAIALSLANAGFLVFAGVRKKSDKYALEKLSKNIIGVYLDITNNKSIDKAFWFILKKTDTLFALINNAGIAVGGPMEFLPVKKIKEQFDINTFGAVALSQKFLPILDGGKIINISSMASTGIFPFIAPYAASKRALDILFNALSIELNSKQIKIVSIKPGIVKTPIWKKSLRNNQQIFCELPSESIEKYKKELNMLERNSYNSDEKGISPDEVAKVVLKVINLQNPKPSYCVGNDAFWVTKFAKLPQRVLNYFIKLVLKKRTKC